MLYSMQCNTIFHYSIATTQIILGRTLNIINMVLVIIYYTSMVNVIFLPPIIMWLAVSLFILSSLYIVSKARTIFSIILEDIVTFLFFCRSLQTLIGVRLGSSLGIHDHEKHKHNYHPNYIVQSLKWMYMYRHVLCWTL